jgi:hypothetical protein
MILKFRVTNVYSFSIKNHFTAYIEIYIHSELLLLIKKIEKPVLSVTLLQWSKLQWLADAKKCHLITNHGQ